MTVFDPFLAPRVRRAASDIVPNRHPYDTQSGASPRQLSGYSAPPKHAKYPTFEYVVADTSSARASSMGDPSDAMSQSSPTGTLVVGRPTVATHGTVCATILLPSRAAGHYNLLSMTFDVFLSYAHEDKPI